MSREFSKLLNNNLSEMMKAMGFKKKGIGFTKSISSEISIYADFNKVSQMGQVLLGPGIGIINLKIKRIYDDLLNGNLFCCVASSLGYLMPANRWLEYCFTEGQDNKFVFDQMKADIVQYGYPYCEKFFTLEAVQGYYENLGRQECGPQKHILPIIYYLLGDKAKGMMFIDNRIAENKRKRLADSITTSETDDGVCHATTINVYRYDKEYEDFGERFKQLPDMYNPDDWK